MARVVHSHLAMVSAQSHDGTSTSVWIATSELPETHPLGADLTTEICVVGAGIAGLSVAYELVRRGFPVAVIDSGGIGGGQTGRTTAHFASALDDRFHHLERLHGERGARLACESHRSAIDRVEAIVTEEQIDCGFERLDGYLFLAPGDSPDLLDRELEAALRAGHPCERLEKAPLPFHSGPCLRFPDQAQLHPMRYLAGLARAFIARGGVIYTGTHAESITGGFPAQIRTSNACTITADVVVVATNVPVNDLAVMHTKQAPYRSYVIGARVPSGAVSKALFWDTKDPYHYVRLAEDEGGELLIVGGEDHKTGQDGNPEERWQRLEAWTRERFPMITEVPYRWSGQVIEPIDGLAFIGRNPMDGDNVFIVTGDSGHGMTHGAIAGMLISDLIEGERNPWADLYDPRRRTVRAAAEFAKENLNVARQYTDWLKKGDVEDSSQIAPGEGAVIRRGLQLIATHVDTHGVTHACSAMCPHLGGVVHWNAAEKTWDCPCHGSRFDALGNVIEGPAIAGLEPVNPSRVRAQPKDEAPKPRPLPTPKR